MRVNTNMLEAQGARLIKTISDQVINTGRFISQEISFFHHLKFLIPPNLKREQRHSEQTFLTCVMGEAEKDPWTWPWEPS